jgi:hypothetical protein
VHETQHEYAAEYGCAVFGSSPWVDVVNPA